MTKTYQIMITRYADERDFMQWFVTMDTKQLAQMRALLKRGVEGHAYASFLVRPLTPGAYSRVYRDIAAMVKDQSH